MSSLQVTEIGTSFNQEEYNRRAPHPMQSWQWGEARKQLGIRVVRIGEFHDGMLSNVFQLSLHPVMAGWSIGYLPRSVYPSESVFRFLRELGKKERLIFIKIEPYERMSGQPIPADAVRSGHALFPDWTQILDLTQPEEKLLTQMKAKTRYNIRLAEKKGVTVKEESDEKGYLVFEKLYFETCRRQHYYGHTPRYHRAIFNTLKANIAHILTAYYEGTPLASYELFHFGDTFYYPYGGSSTEHRNLMPANLLMWEAIRMGKRLGAKKFDMWGSLPPGYSQNDGWAGFTRFKEGYGTEYVRMISGFDLVIYPNLYRIYNLLYLLRKRLLELKKSL